VLRRGPDELDVSLGKARPSEPRRRGWADTPGGNIAIRRSVGITLTMGVDAFIAVG